MNKSETIGALVAALCKAREEFKPILKTATNPYFNRKYATLDVILEAVSVPLAKNGLTALQTPEGDAPMEELTTILAHSSGEWVSSSYGLHATKQDPQSLGSAITYARRYALAAILGVAAESDDDAAAATQGKAQAKEAPKQGHLKTAVERVESVLGKSNDAPESDTFSTGLPACKTCGGEMRYVDAGTSKSGKAYEAFWGCKDRECKGGAWKASEWDKELTRRASAPATKTEEDIPF